MSRDFDLGDILSITTGKLVSPRHVEGVYDILGYMSGESLMTHQLPRVSRECEGPLLKQLPQLAEIEPPDFGGSKEAVFAWLGEMKAIYGETLTVEPLAEGIHERIDALEEAMDLVGPDKVFVFPSNDKNPD